ncbi:MAG: preprotein translocase subunit SecE [Solirubrobacteraceae bacterium]
MARNRQRAKDRKQRQQSGSDAEPLDDAPEGLQPAGGAPPDNLGTAAPPVDFADDDDDPELARDHVGAGAGDVATPPTAKRSLVFQITGFLRACWAELQRVQWPDRRQVGQATTVVLGFVVIAGAFLGLADVVAQRIIDFIL